MFNRIQSACLQGIQAVPVDIEVDSSPGLPGFSMVGLPDSAVREARERVIAAIRSSGYQAGGTRMTVNLSPADLRKEGSAFDLGLAIAMLIAQEQVCLPKSERFVFLGELSLDGRIRPVRGVLSVAAAMSRRKMSGQILVVSPENRAEALCVNGVAVLAPENLLQCLEWIQNPESYAVHAENTDKPLAAQESSSAHPDFSSVVGLSGVCRALEICAAGAHNFLLVGSPGSGKTLSARCLPGILPPLDWEEALETTMIHSCAGILSTGSGLVMQRPFRAPHHSASAAALIGGGRLRPGEISLAHQGVLFLDELPEFQRSTLESLRQPIEEGVVRIERALGIQEWPARFMLGAAMNPCPCGFAMDPRRGCRCLPDSIARYRSRVSGPLLDRIDVQVAVPSAALSKGSREEKGESSRQIRSRVIAARQIQQKRNAVLHVNCNGHIGGNGILDVLHWHHDTERFAIQAADKMAMSRRGFYRILKVSRTIADLRCSKEVTISDVAEALQYRGLEMNWK